MRRLTRECSDVAPKAKKIPRVMLEPVPKYFLSGINVSVISSFFFLNFMRTYFPVIDVTN